MKKYPIFILLLLLPLIHLYAGEVDVLQVQVTLVEEGTYRFDVTLSHNDEGWKHYANKWDVVGPDGIVLGTRVLYHPHVNEQPFTRSLSGLKIPNHVQTVNLRAHDSIHGYGGQVITVKLSEQKRTTP
ncbi:MAG: hypothetical protein HQM14_19370 [SAR324 cluster bacterium]|nr:hypothetical protein [SAR324 cluster bacterium]